MCMFICDFILDARPWTLDVTATMEYLGLIDNTSVTDPAFNQNSFDAWILSLGSASDSEKLHRLLLMLYQGCCFCTTMISTLILAVTFLAAKSRVLIFTVQMLICISLVILLRFCHTWHPTTNHISLIILLLGLNITALVANCIEIYLRMKKPPSKQS